MLELKKKNEAQTRLLADWLDLVRECLWYKSSLHALLTLNLQYLRLRHDWEPETVYMLQAGLQQALDRYDLENPNPADVDFLLSLDPAADPEAFAEVQNAFIVWKTSAWNWFNVLTDLSRQAFRNATAQEWVAQALADAPPPVLPDQPLAVKRRLRSIAFLEALTGGIALTAPPQWLILDQNNVCNFKCKMCTLHAEGIKFAPAYFTALNALGPSVAWAGKITLGGTGEPLMHPKLSALLQHKLAETTVTLNTNGSLLPQRGDQLAGMDEIDISFDGDNPQTFETLRTGGRFDALLEAIRDFARSFPNKIITLNVVVSSVNVDEIYGISALAVALGIRYVVLNPIYPSAPLAFLRLSPQDQAKLQAQFKRLEADFPGKITVVSNILPGDMSGQSESAHSDKAVLLERLRQTRCGEPVPPMPLEEILRQLVSLSSFSWWPHPPSARVQAPAQPPYTLDTLQAREHELVGQMLGAARFRFPYCLAPWLIAYVHAQGTVRPCCFYPYAMEDSLHHKPLAEIWNGPAYRDLRAAMLGRNELPATCRACTASMRQTYKDKLIPFAAQYGYQYLAETDTLEFRPQTKF